MTNFQPDISRFPEYEMFEPADESGSRSREEQNEMFRQGAVTNLGRDYPLLVVDHMKQQNEVF